MSDYPIVEDMDQFVPINNNILVIWEEAKEDLLAGKLVRPETYRGAHFTGIIKKVGPDVVDEDIKPGKRVLFERFSGFVKMLDAKTKERLAIINEPACIALVPPRLKVGSGAAGFDYDV